MLAVILGAFLLVTWAATRDFSSFFRSLQSVEGYDRGVRPRMEDGKPAIRVARLDATRFLLLLTEDFSCDEDEYDLASIPSIFRVCWFPQPESYPLRDRRV
jgi:hypothetical protein